MLSQRLCWVCGIKRNRKHRVSSLITKHNGKKTPLLQWKRLAELIVWQQTVNGKSARESAMLVRSALSGSEHCGKAPLSVHGLLREHVHVCLCVSVSLSEARCV